MPGHGGLVDLEERGRKTKQFRTRVIRLIGALLSSGTANAFATLDMNHRTKHILLAH
jgi:hypothetical protein